MPHTTLSLNAYTLHPVWEAGDLHALKWLSRYKQGQYALAKLQWSQAGECFQSSIEASIFLP